jgi:hypothetical protein
MVEYPWGSTFTFANEHQRFISGAETPELLIDEFQRLFDLVDRTEWEAFTAPVVSDQVPLRLR